MGTGLRRMKIPDQALRQYLSEKAGLYWQPFSRVYFGIHGTSPSQDSIDDLAQFMIYGVGRMDEAIARSAVTPPAPWPCRQP